MENIPDRKTIRLNKDIYQEQGRPFSITVCSYNRIPMLKRFGELIFKSIREGHLKEKSDLMVVCVCPKKRWSK
jgi:hypothetical protein